MLGTGIPVVSKSRPLISRAYILEVMTEKLTNERLISNSGRDARKSGGEGGCRMGPHKESEHGMTGCCRGVL